MDQKSITTLEFDKVRRRLASYTSFSAGRELAQALVPTTEQLRAERWQAETAEALLLQDRSSDATIGGARDVRQPVDNAQRGGTLQPESLLNVRETIIAARNLRRYLLKNQDEYPQLAEIAELIEECPGIVSAISRTIDEHGEVLDSASDRLGQIRRDLRRTHDRIHDRLQRIISGSESKWLQEPLISMRSGRYVVPVRIEARSRVKGIVHDQSSSGATLWVEPIGTVELNNEYRSLQVQEQDEIQRILAALSAKIAEQGDSIKRVVERMAELDLIFARAQYAGVTNAVQPIFVDWKQSKSRKAVHHPGSTVWIRAARHPLLDPETVVPTDFLVDEDVFLVLITGPNTGGKTVSLKNLGLMVLMAQSGLHLPANEARLTVFDNVFADIGDEQSIEQSLSTFSGHITNIIRILDNVSDRSLVLFDELGSGTDPAEGAAIAQSIVSFLKDRGATTFVATHYPELKVYASQTPGATNASLLFDEETLSPTFEMTIGLPGRSNAVAIARRLGLNETILDEALQLLGRGTQDAEELLESIYDIREQILTEEAATRLAQREADEARDELVERLADIETERQAILDRTRQEAEDELQALRDEIRSLRSRLKDAASLTAVKKVKQEAETLEDVVEETAAARRREVDDRPVPQKDGRRERESLEEGDAVKVKSLGVQGTILRLDGKEAEVAVGRLKMRAEVRDLVLVERAAPPEPEESSEPRVRKQASPGMELDLRGKRVDEGLTSLDRYLDSAYLASLPWVRIIHGKGTGRMREAVRRELKKRSDVASFREGEPGEGGAGVTVVKFNE